MKNKKNRIIFLKVIKDKRSSFVKVIKDKLVVKM